MNRRSFLAGLGVSMAAAPFIPLLESSAGGSEFPRRLVLVFSANGTIRESWLPSGSEQQFTLGPILAPLTTHQDKIVVLDGIGIPNVGPGTSHARGIASLWNGHTILPGALFEGGDGNFTGWGGGISIDQHLANELGPVTPFKSLEFAVQAGLNDVRGRMSYAGPDAPIPPVEDPALMFDRLFGEYGLGEEAFARLRARRQSVIDAVRDDLHRLDGKVSSSDKHKIEAHVEAVRAIEQRLDGSAWGEGCVVPDEPTLVHHQNDNYPAVLDAHTELLVMALACGMTSICTLQWSRAVSFTRFTWLGIGEGHHGISHLPDTDAVAVQNLTDINTWYAQRFAELLAALDAVPEGDGTMLDNTMVVWGNELARGNSHSSYPIPFVVGGSCGGKIDTGRYLQLSDQYHGRLLVSICHAMGLEQVESFGDMDPAPGPLPGLVS